MSDIVLRFKNGKWIDPNGEVSELGIELSHLTWGIYDPVESVWMGDDHGPVLLRAKDKKGKLEAHATARIAAAISNVQLGYEPGRLIAKEYDFQPKRLRRLRRYEDGDARSARGTGKWEVHRMSDPWRDLICRHKWVKGKCCACAVGFPFAPGWAEAVRRVLFLRRCSMT